MNCTFRQEIEDGEAELDEVLARIEARVSTGTRFDARRDACCQHARALLFILRRTADRLLSPEERTDLKGRLALRARRLGRLAAKASRRKPRRC